MTPPQNAKEAVTRMIQAECTYHYYSVSRILLWDCYVAVEGYLYSASGQQPL